MSQINKPKEQGQILVMFVISLVAMLMLLTLVLDGGLLLVRRREAQVSADAGALAGVIHLCGADPDPNLAQSVAIQYATVENQGTSASVTFPSSTRIRVLATVDQPPSLAGLFGWGNIGVQADAAAECLPAGQGTGVLPVAFNCRPPLNEETPSDSEDCELKYGEGHIYVVMDTNQSQENFECIYPPNSQGTEQWESGDMDCDIDNDGIDDIIDAGNRGWLDFNGGSNSTSDTNYWINNGYDGEITTHTWYPGSPGVASSSFDNVDGLGPPYPIVILPIFDEFCNASFDPEIDCADKYHSAPEDQTVDGGGNRFYYHISSFILFQITCVQRNNSPNEECPARQAYWPDDPDVASIEGYMVEGYDPDLGSGLGSDTGAYIVRLYD